MVLKVALIVFLLVSVAQCDRSLSQVSGSKASYDALVEARQGAPNELVQIINSILAKFFPGKFSDAVSPTPATLPPITAIPAPTSPPATPAPGSTPPVTPTSGSTPPTTPTSGNTPPATPTSGSTPPATPAPGSTPPATPAPTSTPPPTSVGGCFGPDVTLSFEDIPGKANFTGVGASGRQFGEIADPFTYHGVNFTAGPVRGVMEIEGTANSPALITPTYLFKQNMTTGPDGNPTAGAPLTLYSVLGSVQVQSFFYNSGQTNDPPSSAPSFPVSGTVSGTLKGDNVPGCQKSVTFPPVTTVNGTSSGVQVSYAPGQCVVDHLILDTLTRNVNVNNIVLCAADLPNGLTSAANFTPNFGLPAGSG